MKRYFLIGTLLILPCFLAGQNLTFDQKIEKLLRISGAYQNFERAVTKVLDLQREEYRSELSKEYLDQFEKEIRDEGLNVLVPKIILVYKQQFTEEDIDGLITFYESKIGVKLAERLPYIVDASMEIGGEWANKINEAINQKLEKSYEAKFNTVPEEDCAKFHKGKFEFYVANGKKVVVTRKKKIQREEYSGQKGKYLIEWLQNNRYALTNADGEDPRKILVNIYEVDGNTYKYVSYRDGLYKKGTVTKVD